MGSCQSCGYGYSEDDNETEAVQTEVPKAAVEEPKRRVPYDKFYRLLVVGGTSSCSNDLVRTFSDHNDKLVNSPRGTFQTNLLNIDETRVGVAACALEVEPEEGIFDGFESFHGIMVVFSMDSLVSMHEADQLMLLMGKKYDQSLPKLLVGLDKETSTRAITTAGGEELADIHSTKFLEVTTSTEDATTAFTALIRQLLNECEEE